MTLLDIAVLRGGEVLCLSAIFIISKATVKKCGWSGGAGPNNMSGTGRGRGALTFFISELSSI